MFNEAPPEEIEASNSDLSDLKKYCDDVKRRRKKLDQQGVVEQDGKPDYKLSGYLRAFNDKMKREDAAKDVARPSAAPVASASVAKAAAASAAPASAPAASSTEGKRGSDTVRPYAELKKA